MRADIHLLRHILATVIYRLHAVVDVVPDGFEKFNAGNDVRTPGEILVHMIQIMQYTHRVFDRSADVTEPAIMPFSQLADKFTKHVSAVDKDLVITEPTSLNLAKKLIQGGFSDMLTHVGQLAMLARLAGYSVPGRDYSKEAIAAVE